MPVSVRPLKQWNRCVALACLVMLHAVPLAAQERTTARDFDGVDVHSLYGINTADLEYAPTVTADGRHLYFVSDRPGGEGRHDFWMADLKGRRDSVAVAVRNLGSTINSPNNEGAAAIAADGQTMYFTACSRPDGVGDCDIYEARLEGTTWRVVRNVKEINSSYWDSQPSISSDGRQLYFVSNRPGAIGGPGDGDIYVAERREDGTWSTPRNLGAPINTPQREDSPFILAGGGAFYFASAGHGGFGGLDFFVSRRKTDGTWGEPENLGAPINTARDQRFITLPAAGDVVYFASETRDGLLGGGMLDIYVGLLPPRVATILVEGRVYNRATGESLAADLMFLDSATGETLYGSSTNAATGEYSLVINAGGSSTIEVYGIANGYGPIRATIHVPQADSYTELTQDFPVSAGPASATSPATGEGEEAIHLFPNPADRSLTVEVSGSLAIEGMKDVEILDAFGHRMLRTTMHGERRNIDVEGMPSGVYVIRIGSMTAAFVIRR